MPILYLWLLVVAGMITAADYYYYHYKYWFAQGTAMGLIVMIAVIIFGCGTKRFGGTSRGPGEGSITPG